eukprot:CAMPEP_0181325336 /NCGR_PEP_ID=MMETSP1101-20121128/20863_1 /TAXON_ID=46948 /ORGANISM="Rhodomonas abbreviata, Strain Caron Lab Isolate" /LENGTH=158 /DNA_ID=CAMNT_0023433621 /DNA_START=46 /DNA_END=519 /DNA_ORIENTATION=-
MQPGQCRRQEGSHRLKAMSVYLAGLCLIVLVAITAHTMMRVSPRQIELEGCIGGCGGISGYPAPVNTYQDPTKWNGDHSLNGGNKEWSEEDGALHAYNMNNWRNKIMETELGRQRRLYQIMNVHEGQESYQRRQRQYDNIARDGEADGSMAGGDGGVG